jgi:antirestriction protein
VTTDEPDHAESDGDGQGETPQRSRPRIYVASLADYNAGRLHGAWVDAAQEPAEIGEDVASMLASSREPNAEEWAIHDFDGFGPAQLAEYAPVELVSLLARGIVEHGRAFAAWWQESDIEAGTRLDELSQRFADSYRGHWETTSDYAEQLLDEMGATAALEQLPEWLQPHVQLDCAGLARDLELGGDICTVSDPDGGVYIFDAMQ